MHCARMASSPFVRINLEVLPPFLENPGKFFDPLVLLNDVLVTA